MAQINRDYIAEPLRAPRPDDKPEVVAGHLSARKAQRRVLLICSLVGMAGFGILVAVGIGAKQQNTFSTTLTAPL